MASFDNLPEARPRQQSANARKKPGAPKPSRPVYEFTGPEDTPKGASYRKTGHGFVASAPTGTWLMGLLTALITFGLVSMLWATKGNDDVPMSFFIVIGTVAVIFFVLALYFTIGRIGVKVDGDQLTISKQVLGLGGSATFSLVQDRADADQDPWRATRPRLVRRVRRQGPGLRDRNRPGDQALRGAPAVGAPVLPAVPRGPCCKGPHRERDLIFG